MPRFVVDRSVRRTGGGTVLIGGSPLTLMRLSRAGASLLDRLEAAESGEARAFTPNERVLVDRLLDAGIVHPLPDERTTPLAVTVVVPAFAPATSDLLAIVAACADAAQVIVVDDASPVAVPPIEGATVVRHTTNQGPGAARTTGAALGSTPLIAFVDTDVVLAEGWLGALVAHFADDRVALVAPRVASASGPSVLERYEHVHSPLDLGPEPARIRAGTRVGYVPSACVVVRASALHAIGGFDPEMRVGEDVDLVWRFDEAGHGLRYEPASVVHHRPRPTLTAWARQRFDYGSSAAPLASRHDGAVAPVRVSGWSAAAWTTTVLGFPLVGGAVAAVTTALLVRKLRHVPDGAREAVRLAGLGHLYAGRSLASAVMRAWWPLAFVAALCSRRVRRAVAIAALVPPAIDWARRRPPISAPAFVVLRVLDDLSYGAGVTAGVVRERSLAAMRPDFSSWPTARRRPPLHSADAAG